MIPSGFLQHAGNTMGIFCNLFPYGSNPIADALKIIIDNSTSNEEDSIWNQISDLFKINIENSLETDVFI